MLLDDGAELVVGGVSFDIEQFVWIGVCEKDVSSDHCFDCVEGEKLGFMPTFTEKFVRL
jgi:hypothetical protein